MTAETVARSPATKKRGRLQAHNQRLFRARGPRGDAELIALGRHARRRPPARERVGEFHFDHGLAVLVGDDVSRLPEDRRAEIAANLHGRLLSCRSDLKGGYRCGFSEKLPL